MRHKSIAFFENLIEVEKLVKECQCYLFLLPYWLPNLIIIA
jgi:hypothetical protein